MKGDRFTRMVERSLGHRVGSYSNSKISALLRKEHRAVRREIKKHYPTYDDTPEEKTVSRTLTQVLASLDRLRGES